VIRCFIVDDNVPFLQAASSRLSRDGIDVVGTATNSAEAVAAAKRLQFDVALVDVSLGEESGLDLTRELASLGRDFRIVLISTRSEEDLAPLIEGSPAAGFIPKSRLSPQAVLEMVAG
jgi:DNA-binding NarL/FixJ family response regulator